jgi:hypothetical protein
MHVMIPFIIEFVHAPFDIFNHLQYQIFKNKIKIEMNYTHVKSTLQKMHNFIR